MAVPEEANVDRYSKLLDQMLKGMKVLRGKTFFMKHGTWNKRHVDLLCVM